MLIHYFLTCISFGWHPFLIQIFPSAHLTIPFRFSYCIAQLAQALGIIASPLNFPFYYFNTGYYEFLIRNLTTAIILLAEKIESDDRIFK